METSCIGELESGHRMEITEMRHIEPVKETRLPRPQIQESKQLLDWRRVKLGVLAILCAFALLGYGLCVRAPQRGWLRVQDGGFWSGFIIAGALSMMTVTTITFRLEKILSTSRDFRSLPTHCRPSNQVAHVTHVKRGLNTREYRKFTLKRKESLSSNVYLFAFSFSSDKTNLGLPIGQHVAICAIIDGRSFSWSYTPISNNSDHGDLSRSSLFHEGNTVILPRAGD